MRSNRSAAVTVSRQVNEAVAAADAKTDLLGQAQRSFLDDLAARLVLALHSSGLPRNSVVSGGQDRSRQSQQSAALAASKPTRRAPKRRTVARPVLEYSACSNRHRTF